MRRAAALAVLLTASLAVLATSWVYPPDRWYPCDGEPRWDPNAPLYLEWGNRPAVPANSANFRSGLRLVTAGGDEVRWIAAYVGNGVVHVCPIGGLRPDTAYRWQAGPFANDVQNHARVPQFRASGELSFRTARSTVLMPILTVADCAAFSDWSFSRDACVPDSGWWWDSGARDTGEEIDADGDGVPAWRDCDDDDASVYPGAVETCDGRDEDCDGSIDEDAGELWYLDADGDGWGADPGVAACSQPAGHVADGGDCNDADPTMHPGADDPPGDGIDSDCDGAD